jgi:hypothetical protein
MGDLLCGRPPPNGDEPLTMSHAHNVLVDAIGKNGVKDATELMTSHVVDLLSGLDLSERAPAPKRLADILRRSTVDRTDDRLGP